VSETVSLRLLERDLLLVMDKVARIKGVNRKGQCIDRSERVYAWGSSYELGIG
jgi:hypothetical protein